MDFGRPPSSSSATRRIAQVRETDASIESGRCDQRLLPLRVQLAVAVGLRVAEIGNPSDRAGVGADVMGRQSCNGNE